MKLKININETPKVVCELETYTIKEAKDSCPFIDVNNNSNPNEHIVKCVLIIDGNDKIEFPRVIFDENNLSLNPIDAIPVHNGKMYKRIFIGEQNKEQVKTFFNLVNGELPNP